LEIALDEPLCNIEWNHIAEIINSVNGMCWFQVLPVGMKSSLPLQFNVIHFLPEARYPFAQLPIDTFLKNNESNERKIERRMTKEAQENLKKADTSARGEFEQNAKAQSFVVIPEFNFRHVVYKMTEHNLSPDGLTYSYTKCAVFLGLKDDEHSGVTTILTNKWMMVAQLSKEYMENEDQMPVFLDGFAYAGLAQL